MMNLEQARAIRMQIGTHPRTLYLRLVRGRRLFDFDDPPWGSIEVGTYDHDVSPTELCDDADAAENELWAALTA